MNIAENLDFGGDGSPISRQNKYETFLGTDPKRPILEKYAQEAEMSRSYGI